MKWILVVLAVLVALVLVVVVGGYMLPVAHTVSRSRVVQGTPEQVFSTILDVDSFPEWRPGVTEAVRLQRADGSLAWRERGSAGDMTLEVIARDRPRRLVTRIADAELPFGGGWTYELTPQDGGTRVTITEDGEVYNPIFRFVSRFIMGHAATLESYLDALERRMAVAA